MTTPEDTMPMDDTAPVHAAYAQWQTGVGRLQDLTYRLNQARHVGAPAETIADLQESVRLQAIHNSGIAQSMGGFAAIGIKLG
jgi:hypothetical protein